MTPPLAASGALFLVGFALLVVVVLAYNYYTVKGSGISEHPNDGLDGAPGSEAPSDVSKGRGADGADVDGNLGGTFSSHGTK